MTLWRTSDFSNGSDDRSHQRGKSSSNITPPKFLPHSGKIFVTEYLCGPYPRIEVSAAPRSRYRCAQAPPLAGNMKKGRARSYSRIAVSVEDHQLRTRLQSPAMANSQKRRPHLQTVGWAEVQALGQLANTVAACDTEHDPRSLRQPLRNALRAQPRLQFLTIRFAHFHRACLYRHAAWTHNRLKTQH